MSEQFFKKPILNSPYEYPSRHWQLEAGLPTHNILNSRRRAEFITPIINQLRSQIDDWRKLPNERDWMVTPSTARLLKHWRHHPFNNIRPFFCQIEAVEVAIWLTEVAPKRGKTGRQFLDHLQNARPSTPCVSPTVKSLPAVF